MSLLETRMPRDTALKVICQLQDNISTFLDTYVLVDHFQPRHFKGVIVQIGMHIHVAILFQP